MWTNKSNYQKRRRVYKNKRCQIITRCNSPLSQAYLTCETRIITSNDLYLEAASTPSEITLKPIGSPPFLSQCLSLGAAMHFVCFHCFHACLSLFYFCLVLHYLLSVFIWLCTKWLLDTMANRNPKIDVRPWKAWALRLRSHERRWSPAWRAPGLPVPRVHFR